MTILHTLSKTLPVAFALLLVVVPVGEAGPVEEILDCFTATMDHEPGRSELMTPSTGFGYAFVAIPGPDAEGQMGMHYIEVEYREFNKCMEDII